MAYLILILAFILRLIYIIQLKSTIFYSHFLLDEAFYNNWAKAIAKGEWIREGVFDALPLYPYILGIIYKFTNSNLFIPRLIQCAVGSLSCVLIYYIAKKLFKNNSAAAITGVIAAFYVPFIFYCGVLMPATYLIFFYLLVIWLSLKVIEGLNLLIFLWLGISTGFAALTGAGILLFLPAVLGWIIYVSKQKKKAAIGAIIALLSACFILSPVMLKDLFLTSHAGLNFYIGNNENADGTFKQPSWARSNIEGLKQDAATIAGQETGRRLTESEVSRFYFAKGMRFIKEKPLLFLKLLARKSILLINRYEIFDTAGDPYIYRDYIPIFRFSPFPLLFTFLVIASLGLGGMIVSVSRRRLVMPLYIFVATYAATLLIYFINARYRLPIAAAMIIFSGYLISWLIGKIKERNYKAISLSFLLILAIFFAVNADIGKGKSYISNSYVNLGNLYMQAGDLEQAKHAFYKAIKGIAPDDPKPYNDLGYVLLQQNDLKYAEQNLQEALSKDPGYPFAHVNLGLLYEKKDLPDAAEREYKEAIRLNPNIAEAHNNLANIYEKKNKRSLAIEEYKRAIELDPYNAKTHYNLGVVYARQGMLNEAQEEFKKSVELDPEFTPAHDALKYF